MVSLDEMVWSEPSRGCLSPASSLVVFGMCMISRSRKTKTAEQARLGTRLDKLGLKQGVTLLARYGVYSVIHDGDGFDDEVVLLMMMLLLFMV